MNVLLTVDYIGTRYHGWQRQSGLVTVQQTIEDAIKRLTNQTVSLTGSGRTDAGVHALAQTASFELVSPAHDYNFVKGLNHFLPEDVRVLDAKEVPADFNARFSAHKKTYEYVIYEGKTDRAIFLNRAYRCGENLDVDKMNKVAEVLTGEHDFASFMSSGSTVNSTVRNLYELKAERRENVIVVTATANGFLYNMVRRLVAVLIRAGKSVVSVCEVKEILDKKDGKLIKDIVPAYGLYLKEVDYGEEN